MPRLENTLPVVGHSRIHMCPRQVIGHQCFGRSLVHSRECRHELPIEFHYQLGVRSAHDLLHVANVTLLPMECERSVEHTSSWQQAVGRISEAQSANASEIQNGAGAQKPDPSTAWSLRVSTTRSGACL